MVVRSIPLKLDTKLDFVNGFKLMVTKKSQNLVIFLSSVYENKIANSSVNKTNWKKTQKLLKEELESKGVTNDHINLILDTLDNNSDIILGNIDGSSNDTTMTTDNLTPYENREMSKEWVITEIDRAKAENKNISLEDWRDGLVKRYTTAKEITERNFPHAWEGIEFTLLGTEDFKHWRMYATFCRYHVSTIWREQDSIK